MSRLASILCLANFPSGTGYAWDFIEGLYAKMADRLANRGITMLVAYPSILGPVRKLADSAARTVVLDTSLDNLASVYATGKLIRRENVRVLYLTDRPVWSWAYVWLRWAGVQRIIVHDHSSGERKRPPGLKRMAKWLLLRVPGITADVVVAVSDYVARRQIEVGLVPRERVVRVWNGLPVPALTQKTEQSARALLGLGREQPIIMCICRATPEKGVYYLLRAFDRMLRDADLSNRRPVLIYIGDGPQLGELRSLRESLASKHAIILTGYRPDASELIEDADVCVVPSVWQEAFGLAALEAMAWGKPVVASGVGGIAELIEHGVDGVLVPPGDEIALADAIQKLLTDAAGAALLGNAARRRVAGQFNPEEQLERLVFLVEEGLRSP